MSENAQKPWQAWCAVCLNDADAPRRIWTGMTEEEASTGALVHIALRHDGAGDPGTWRNPDVQWTDQ